MPYRPERLNTVQMVRRFYRSWWKRPFWLLGLLVLAVVAGRIALTPTLMKHLNEELRHRVGEGAVTFRDLDVYLFPPTFVFRDVSVRAAGAPGEAAETLEIPRVEIHTASLRALRQPVPPLRMRLERPALRLTSSSQGLERLARALPAARIEIVTISEGSVSNAAAPDGRPVIDHLTGELEGLASGTEVGKTKWQFWGDGQLLGGDPLHLVIGGAPTGTWYATVAGREAEVAAGGQGPAPALNYDGDVRGSAHQFTGLLHVRWTGDNAPTALAEGRSRALDERWPSTELRVLELRPGVGPESRGLDVVLGRNDEGGEGQMQRLDSAAGAVGLVVGMVRLGNRAVATPTPGLAALDGGSQ